MGKWQEQYFNRFYPTPGYRDSVTTFYSLIEKNVSAGSHVLEIGPGGPNPRSKRLAALCGSLDGLDIDEAAKQNGALSQAYVYSGETFPMAGGQYDAVISLWANEHIEHPEIHCKEIGRVLKPGGIYIFNTPNNYHYATIIAHYSPYWFHLLVANRARNFSKNHRAPHPTFYRFNSRRKCFSLMKQAGLQVDHFQIIEDAPAYLLFARLAYLIGVAYERIVNSSARFENLRQSILCIARKP